jgi:hypothetical protein
MDCKHVNEHLIDLLYLELEPDQLDQIEGHLEGCDGCAAELAAFESTRSAMRELPELEPPPSLSQALMREAARAVTPPDTQGFWERLRAGMRMMVLHPAMTAAAVLVLVLGVSFMVYRGGGPTGLTPRADDLPPVLAPATTVEAPGTQQLVVEGRPDNNELGWLAKKIDQPGAAVEGKGGAIRGLATAAPPATDPEEDTRDKIARGGRTTRVPLTARRGRRARPRLAAAARPAPQPKLAYRNKRPEIEVAVVKPPARRTPTSRGGDGAQGSGSKLDSLDGYAKAPKARPRGRRVAGTPRPASLLAAKGDEAMAAGKCELAFRYYDQALRADKALAKHVGAMVQRCTGRVGTDGLARAQKRYPMLAGWFRTEARKRAAISRKRKADRKNAAPPTGKRRSSEQRQEPAAPRAKPPK